MKSILKGISSLRHGSRTRRSLSECGSRRSSCLHSGDEPALASHARPALLGDVLVALGASPLRAPQAPPQPASPPSPSSPRGGGQHDWDPIEHGVVVAPLLASGNLSEVVVVLSEEEFRQESAASRRGPLSQRSRLAGALSGQAPLQALREPPRPAIRLSPRLGCVWDPVDDTANDAAIAALLAELPRTPSPVRRFRARSETPERSTPAGIASAVSSTARPGVVDAIEANDAAIAAALAEVEDLLAAGGPDSLGGAHQEPEGPRHRPRSPRRLPPRQRRGRSSQRARPSDQEASRPLGADETACVACLDAAATALLVPCGHISLCVPCAGRLDPLRCPLCRLDVEQVVQIQRKPQACPPHAEMHASL